jgi:maltose O-acetyltransferase
MSWIGWARNRYGTYRLERRWRILRSRGMSIGTCTNLPMSTWIDLSHCHLISVGNNCGFGEECLILAHDAMMNEYLDATRIARVVIHDSCHIGARTVILPGVEIGPRSIVGAGSVVLRSVPPETVAAGNPAKVICTLDEYLERHRRRIAESPTFPYADADVQWLTPEGRERMLRALEGKDGYVTGGYTALLEGTCGLRVTRK